MCCSEREEIRRRFARHLSTYDNAAKIQHFMADHLAELAAAHTAARRFDRILDLGCGTGGTARAFLGTFSCGEIVFCDLVPECEAFLRNITVPHRFFTADLDRIAKLPPVDLVLSGAALQWLSDPGTLFRRITRTLPAGGIFAASTFSAGNLAELTRAGGKTLPSPPPDFWRRSLEAAGFQLLVFEEFSAPIAFGSAVEMLRHLRDTGVMLPVMKNAGEVRRFLRSAEASRGKDGALRLTYRPVFWIARNRSPRNGTARPDPQGDTRYA